MCKTCGCKDAETLEGEDCGCKHENEAESFGADDVDWMKRFVNNKLTQDDIRQANAWSWVAGKNNKHIEKDWLASGDLVGEEDTGTVNGMTFFEYLVMRHRNFTRDWKKGIKPTRNGIEYGSSLFSAEDKTKFELLGSKYIEGVGIVTEGSPYLKNYYGEMDEYNIYDDDAAEIIMSIPMNDARFPLKGGEIELIRAMVYGYEHPRINDSWGELNEDGMFWTTKVMETLANYDPSEAESFEAHDHSHIYPSEELIPSHSHSSETFKSSNNNNNIMAAESKFDKLSDKIAKQYRKKGMSAKEAKEIGNKTAYTIGRKKYGKAGMAKKARAGMRAESFEAEERWYVSDPCYAIPEDRWGEFVNKLPDNLKNKKVDVKWEVDGKEYIVEVWQSPGGDGVWSFPSLNCDFGVDAGLLAVIPEKVAMEGKRPFGGKWFNKKPTLFTDEKKYVVKINNKRNKNVDNRFNPFDAESFEADDDYVIVDRGNYRVRVHKKNLDRFNRSRMSKIHSERNKEGLMYDEETSRWIPLEAESFEAQGNPDKTTTSINPKFFVGKGDGDDLIGKGKFMKYNDALAKAQEVAEKEGKSRVVDNRGFALWTHDGQGLFQKGKSTAQAKKYYRAEEYSIGSGFRLGFGLGLGMLALSTVTTIAALAASTIDERQVEK